MSRPQGVSRRRIVVVIVLVIGAGRCLAFRLRRTPGETSFYWLTFGAGRGLDARNVRHASAWAVSAGAAAGRPVISGGGLVAAQIPAEVSSTPAWWEAAGPLRGPSGGEQRQPSESAHASICGLEVQARRCRRAAGRWRWLGGGEHAIPYASKAIRAAHVHAPAASSARHVAAASRIWLTIGRPATLCFVCNMSTPIDRLTHHRGDQVVASRCTGIGSGVGLAGSDRTDGALIQLSSAELAPG